MDQDLEGLRPELVWKHFDQLRSIPRCSKNEAGAVAYVRSVAERLGLNYRTDAAGNIVVMKPASSGKEGAPSVVLQGHLDMVCEKNKDVTFDFIKDPIQLRKEGEYLYAKGTTLGADNGIGVAAALAVLEDRSLVHGPIEALFTIDEETGLTGAFALGPDMLTARLMINLDTEEERAIYVGCAGGGESELAMNVRWKPATGKAVKVTVMGMKGGHSGVDINLERANALKVLGRILWKTRAGNRFLIGGITGGDKHNAIPREAEAVLVYSSGIRNLKKAVEEAFEDIRFEYRTNEPDMHLSIEECPLPIEAMDKRSTGRVIDLIMALPHGIYRWSPDIPGLVETSTNLAKIRTEGVFYAQLASRSSSKSQLEGLRDHIDAIANMSGASVKRGNAYPGWLPDMESKVLAVLKDCCRELWNIEPGIKAIHAGLETGIVGEKFPGMDMASIGPQIEHPHSPDERVKISSVDEFWALLTLALRKLC